MMTTTEKTGTRRGDAGMIKEIAREAGTGTTIDHARMIGEVAQEIGRGTERDGTRIIGETVQEIETAQEIETVQETETGAETGGTILSGELDQGTGAAKVTEAADRRRSVAVQATHPVNMVTLERLPRNCCEDAIAATVQTTKGARTTMTTTILVCLVGGIGIRIGIVLLKITRPRVKHIKRQHLNRDQDKRPDGANEIFKRFKTLEIGSWTSKAMKTTSVLVE